MPHRAPQPMAQEQAKARTRTRPDEACDLTRATGNPELGYFHGTAEPA